MSDDYQDDLSEAKLEIHRLRAMLAAAKARIADLEPYVESYNLALECVDECFQPRREYSRALLPDFCKLGEDKFRAVIRLAVEYKLQQKEVERLRRESIWIRAKLKLPPDTPFVSGETKTLAGEMHVVCSRADAYETYIESRKCDDKEGEIARLARQLDTSRIEVERLKKYNAELAETVEERAREMREYRDKVIKLRGAIFQGEVEIGECACGATVVFSDTGVSPTCKHCLDEDPLL